MNATKPDGQPDPQQQRDENAVKLFRRLFHTEFCEAENIQQPEKPEVLPGFFYSWLDKEMPTMDQEEICRDAGVDEETWHFVRQLLDSGTAVEATRSIWYLIVLGDRPDPKAELRTINIMFNLTFSDGTISTSQGFISREMLDGPGFNDAMTITVLANTTRQLIEKVAAAPIDELHQQAQKNVFTSSAPEDPFEVMMGVFLKHMLPNIKPEMQKACENYMRLAQQCIRPPIPAHILSAFKQRQEADKAKALGKPRGGWRAH